MHRFWVKFTLVSFGLNACVGTGADSGLVTGEACTLCELTDANNYRFSSSMTISSVELRAGADATIDWSDLTVDIQGHPIATSDIDKLTLLVLKESTQQEVIEALSTDTLQQSDITLYMTCEPEEIGTISSCNLSDFGILNSSLEVENYFIEGTGTWLIALQNDDIQGAASMTFLEPLDSGTEHTAYVDDESASLEVNLSLADLEPRRIGEGADIVVDWSQLTIDGLGNPLSIHTLDTIYLARYTEDSTVLESIPFDLWSSAETLWSTSVAGQTRHTLSSLPGDREFEGITDEWTWLLALTCSTCINPTPRFVTLLESISSQDP